jgi:hypothetical protein
LTFPLTHHIEETTPMMRRAALALACTLVSTACGGSTGPSGQNYTVTVTGTQFPTTNDGSYRRVISLRVTDAAGAPVMGATVRARMTGGTLTPGALVTDAQGAGQATWSFTAAEKSAGGTHSLAFCSRSEGSCQPNIGGGDAVQVSF